VRRLLLTLLAGALALSACGGDDGESADATAVDRTTTTTEAPPADTTFEADDVESLCEDLEGLADIDPEADPTQEQVDEILAIAETAPRGVAGPLSAVAAYGQLALDAMAEGASVSEAAQTEATEAATVLVAYGNEACAIDVPLFDVLAGV
jgi:ABC-type glycerol-3-phosphate transport system substrate-binding protein